MPPAFPCRPRHGCRQERTEVNAMGGHQNGQTLSSFATARISLLEHQSTPQRTFGIEGEREGGIEL